MSKERGKEGDGREKKGGNYEGVGKGKYASLGLGRWMSLHDKST